MKWEYTTIYLNHFELSIESNSLIKVLDGMGQVGWELVAVDNGLIYFKRPLRVELEVMKTEFTEGVIEEMIDKSVKNLVQRGE